MEFLTVPKSMQSAFGNCRPDSPLFVVAEESQLPCMSQSGHAIADCAFHKPRSVESRNATYMAWVDVRWCRGLYTLGLACSLIRSIVFGTVSFYCDSIFLEIDLPSATPPPVLEQVETLHGFGGPRLYMLV